MANKKEICLAILLVTHLKGLQVGDSIVKLKGEWKIKIVKKDTTLYVEPEFPIQLYRVLRNTESA